jgi:hypothetical protein
LDYFQAGSATISFYNGERLFDPLNENATFQGVEPRAQIRVSSCGYPIFTGYINDWDFQYDIAGQDTAVAKCSEAFTVLANQFLSEFTPSVELTGDRVNTVLDRAEVNYRGPRSIDTGRSTLGAFAVEANTNVMNYLHQIERSEFGSFFCAKDGTLVFEKRAADITKDFYVFADDGSGIPYQTLDNQYGDELLYNYIRTQSPAGAEQVAEDADSITNYQVSQLTLTNLLNSSTTEVNGLGRIVLQFYKDAVVRFTGLTVQMAGLSKTQIDDVLGMELTDYAEITKSFAVGSPASYMQTSIITGINHEISPGNHQLRFAIENADSARFMILGDSFFGVLDSSFLDM